MKEIFYFAIPTLIVAIGVTIIIAVHENHMEFPVPTVIPPATLYRTSVNLVTGKVVGKLPQQQGGLCGTIITRYRPDENNNSIITEVLITDKEVVIYTRETVFPACAGANPD